jgi:hypothetical protein
VQHVVVFSELTGIRYHLLYSCDMFSLFSDFEEGVRPYSSERVFVLAILACAVVAEIVANDLLFVIL